MQDFLGVLFSFEIRVSLLRSIHIRKLFEDNSLVRKQLKSDGTGKVHVVGGGGSLYCASLCNQLATLAIENKLAGIIINGCLRDRQLINSMEIDRRQI